MNTARTFFAALLVLISLTSAGAVATHGGNPAYRKPVAAPRKAAPRKVVARKTVAVAQPVAATAAAVALPTARPTVAIHGTVYGPNGRVLPGACVHVFNNADVLAVTNGDGEFLLTNVPATAVLHLQAEYMGLKNVQLDTDVAHANAVSVVMNQR